METPVFSIGLKILQIVKTTQYLQYFVGFAT
jgi:hypothetical protein